MTTANDLERLASQLLNDARRLRAAATSGQDTTSLVRNMRLKADAVKTATYRLNLESQQ